MYKLTFFNQKANIRKSFDNESESTLQDLLQFSFAVADKAIRAVYRNEQPTAYSGTNLLLSAVILSVSFDHVKQRKIVDWGEIAQWLTEKQFAIQSGTYFPPSSHPSFPLWNSYYQLPENVRYISLNCALDVTQKIAG